MYGLYVGMIWNVKESLIYVQNLLDIVCSDEELYHLIGGID